jgi:hypothetical protein
MVRRSPGFLYFGYVSSSISVRRNGAPMDYSIRCRALSTGSNGKERDHVSRAQQIPAYCRNVVSGFYLALLAVLFAGVGARDQVTIAGLALGQGRRPGALAVGIAVSMATAAFAVWAASVVAPVLAPKARPVLAAIALGLAGAEALLIAPGRRPEEPTASLGALAIVLLAHQATDAARFLVFAIAVATNAPVAVGMAGAVGGAALLTAAWLAPAMATDARLRLARRIIGVGLLLLGTFVALRAFGYIRFME